MPCLLLPQSWTWCLGHGKYSIIFAKWISKINEGSREGIKANKDLVCHVSLIKPWSLAWACSHCSSYIYTTYIPTSKDFHLLFQQKESLDNLIFYNKCTWKGVLHLIFDLYLTIYFQPHLKAKQNIFLSIAFLGHANKKLTACSMLIQSSPYYVYQQRNAPKQIWAPLSKSPTLQRC